MENESFMTTTHEMTIKKTAFRAGKMTGFTPGLIPAVPFWIGTGLMLADLFPSLCSGFSFAGGNPWVTGLFTAAAGILLTALFLLIAGKGNAVYFLLAALPGAVFFRAVIPAFRTLINDILSALSSCTGRIYLAYEPSGSAATALLLLIPVIALIVTWAAVYGSILPVLPAVLLVLTAFAAGLTDAYAGAALLFGGILLLPGKGGAGSVKTAAGRAVSVLLCVLPAFLIVLLLQGIDTEKADGALSRQMHEIRYDSAEPSMPEGNLKNLGPWEKNGREALAVTQEVPQKMYLRGHVYETYTGTAWEERAAEERAEDEALFYWLHENGFYGYAEIGFAESLAADGPEERSVTVENLSACTEYGYLPYAYINDGLLERNQIGDAKGIAGGRDPVCLRVVPGSLKEWYRMQYELAVRQEEEGVREYLALEENYRDYVRKADLQMTEESYRVLHRQLGDAGNGKTLYEIQRIIRDYLEDALAYDETSYTMNGNEDFLHTVLEGNGTGYSVHYATAAVMLLRYFGVPARYVEGYYLAPENAAAAGEDGRVLLTEENAHAWAEYYLNGIGFVPFEVTPGYVDPEDLMIGEAGSGEGSGSAVYEPNALAGAVTETPEVEQKESDNRRFLFSPLHLLALLPLALIALLIFVLLRRIRLKKSLSSIDGEKDREYVSRRYGYAMALRERTERFALPEDEKAADLNEKAIFSEEEIRPEDRSFMKQYSEKVLQECRKRWGFFRKIRLRCIDGYY